VLTSRIKAALRPPPWIWIVLAVVGNAWVLWTTLGWATPIYPVVPHRGLLSSPRVFPYPGVVPKPEMFDAGVLLWGSERFQAHQDPLAPKFFGDSGVVYNYPSGWRILSWLRLNRGDRAALAWSFGLLFSATLFWLLPPTNGRAVLLQAAILLSPPNLNALGVGNGELLVVALVAASAKLAERSGLCRELLSLASLGLASVLKLYPAAGFGALAFCRTRLRWKPIVAGAIVGVWFLVTAAEIKSIMARTPQPFANAFGCEVLPARAANLLASHSRWLGLFPGLPAGLGLLAHARLAFRGAYFAVVALGIASGRRTQRLQPKPTGAADDVLMALGAVLFVAAFGIGNSWSHRLLVLILCVAAAARQEGRGRLLLFLVAALWSGLLTGGATFILEQALMWVLLFVLTREIGENVHG